MDTLNSTRDYDFNAVIENGRITSVVIYDRTGTNPGEGPDGSTGKYKVEVDKYAQTVKVGCDASASWSTIANYAMSELETMGYEFQAWDESTQKLTVTNANGGSVDFTVSCYVL